MITNGSPYFCRVTPFNCSNIQHINAYDSCLFVVYTKLNPRTYMYTQNHNPTVVQGGVMEPFLRVFDMLQYFKTILPLAESL